MSESMNEERVLVPMRTRSSGFSDGSLKSGSSAQDHSAANVWWGVEMRYVKMVISFCRPARHMIGQKGEKLQKMILERMLYGLVVGFGVLRVNLFDPFAVFGVRFYYSPC